MNADDKKWLEARFDRLDEKLGEVEKVQVRQEGVLAEHIRRTETNETAIDILRKAMEPLKTHVAVMGAIGKWVLALATLASAAAGVWRALH